MPETNDLNQDQMPTDFFGDGTADEVETSTPAVETESNEENEETEVTEETQETTEETTKETEETPFLKIKFNKEDVDLSQDKAIEYAQKGMNYDKIMEKYNTLNDSITKLAKANGLSNEEYIANLNATQEKFALNQEIENLKKEFPQSDEGLITELAKSRLASAKSQTESIARQKENEQAESQKAEISRQMDVFAKRYPDVDPSKLETGVYNLMKEGYTLLEAYESVNSDKLKQQIAQRDEQAKIQQKNEQNKRKSLGNLNNTGEVEADDFMRGFLSD